MYKVNKQHFYNWEDTISQQTGNQREVCIVVGAKGTGKAFELRKLSQFDYVDTSGLSDETLRTINEHYNRHC